MIGNPIYSENPAKINWSLFGLDGQQEILDLLKNSDINSSGNPGNPASRSLLSLLMKFQEGASKTSIIHLLNPHILIFLNTFKMQNAVLRFYSLFCIFKFKSNAMNFRVAILSLVYILYGRKQIKNPYT